MLNFDKLTMKIHLKSRFEQRLPTGLFEGVLVIVDGTECPIMRPNSIIQNVFYSGKKKRHTIKYEVAVRVSDGLLVWISGPFPGKVHDMAMLHDGNLCSYLVNQERILGDKGYQGQPNV